MIIKLDADVKSKIRSSMKMTSLQSCIVQLLYNALDADCTIVTLKFDLTSSTVCCTDNGSGIEIQDFKHIGHRYFIFILLFQFSVFYFVNVAFLTNNLILYTIYKK